MKHPLNLSDLPEEQSRRLSIYAQILETRAVPLGLISEGDAGRILQRHVLDSCRAARCIPPSARVVVDIGSGAGVPGVPVAIVLPEVRVVLVEPRRKRAAFLEFVVSELGLPGVDVLAERAQDVHLSADVALARAVGDVSMSWSLARPLLRPGGHLVYFAGSSWSAAQAARLEIDGTVPRICDAADRGDGGPLVMIRTAVDEPRLPH